MRTSELRTQQLTVDVKCHLDGIITSWNNSAQRTFGYTAEEVIGEHIFKLIPPDRVQEERDILARLNRGERVEHFETKRLTKDNTLLDLSLTIRQGNYYHPDMKGNFTLKSLMPIVNPEMSFENLNIQSGITAMYSYESLKEGSSDIEKKNEIKIKKTALL